VDSELGKGTTFWFTLSLEVAADNPERSVPVEKKIALFDNCETCSTIITEYLRGCTLRSGVGSGALDILAQLRQFAEEGFSPEILLIDYNAIADDIEVFIDKLATFSKPPPELFVLTRQGHMEHGLKAKGVAGVILKPVRLIQLQEQILGALPREEITPVVRTEAGGTRVLIVDDEHINRHVAQMILEKMGFEVDVAADGEEAVLKTTENQYDVVLMDIQMPTVDGLETTRVIRRRERSRGGVHLPILAMTANALPAMKDRCLAVGMDGFLTKPIKPETLLENLRPYFADAPGVPSRPELKASGRDGDSFSKPAENEVWNRQRALEYLGGDEGLLADLAQLFITRKELLLGALEASMHSGNGEEISSAAHAFKGAVNHFAAGPCQNLALTIENKAGSNRLDGLEEEIEKLKIAAEDLVEQLERQI